MPTPSRAFVPALLIAMLTLAGCQSFPSASDSRSASGAGAAASTPAGQTVQPISVYLAQSQPVEGRTPVNVPGGALYLDKRPFLTRADLSEAAAMSDRQGQHFVGLRLTPSGAKKLDAASRQNIGSLLALVIGNELVAAPRITGPLDSGVLAFGMPSADAAAQLAARIRGDAQ